MRVFPALAFCLLSLPTVGGVRQNAQPQSECKGVVYGVVIGQDRKPGSGIGVVLEPVGDYDYVLPRTKTDAAGAYRFEKVCPGSWGVFVEDKEAGYPNGRRLMTRFLYGHDSPQVEITAKQLQAELNVNAPPKPGQLLVHVTSTRASAKITYLQIKLRVSRKRWIEYSCGLQQSTCEDNPALVPPDQDVKLRVTSKGFHEWKDRGGRGKLLHLSSGQVMTINVKLEPVAIALGSAISLGAPPKPYPDELRHFKFYAKYLSPLRPYISDLDSVTRVLGSDQGRELENWHIQPFFVGKGSTVNGRPWAKDITGRLASISIQPKRRVSMLNVRFPPEFAHMLGGVSEINVSCDVYGDRSGLQYWIYAEDSAVAKKGDLMKIEYGPSEQLEREIEGSPTQTSQR